MSSAKSDYSPIVEFRARTAVTDSVRVDIDRLKILAPGEWFEGMRASTGTMEMQALVVTSNPNANTGGRSDQNGSGKPWLERSASAKVVVSDSLTTGITETKGPLRFSLGMPSGTSLAESWLVFRISGPAKAMPARMADGTEAPAFTLPAIRVFACSIQNLDGRTDKARERVMKEMYSAGC